MPNEAKPVRNHRGRNRTAANATIASLRTAGRLETVDSVRVTALLTLADAVDAEPGNASLWREYRAAESSLREVNDDTSDDLASVIDALSAPLRHEKDPEPPEPRPGGRSSSP